jgi:hypothetical protein
MALKERVAMIQEYRDWLISRRQDYDRMYIGDTFNFLLAKMATNVKWRPRYVVTTDNFDMHMKGYSLAKQLLEEGNIKCHYFDSSSWLFEDYQEAVSFLLTYS